MYKVAICEDEAVFAAELQEMLKHILENLRCDYQIRVFLNAEDLLQEYDRDSAGFDLLLLDVVLDEISGIEAAERIRQKDQSVAIVFITSHKDYAIEGYSVGAKQYLLKPVQEEVLKKLIDRDYRERFQASYLIVESGTTKIRIRINEILYLETVGRKLAIHTKGDTLIVKGRLTEILEKINNGTVVRCHQGYAMNVENVKELRGCDAITVNGQLIPVSRTYQKEVQRVFLQELEI